MNRSQLWGFEVSHIVISFGLLAFSDIVFNIVGVPLIFSWVLCFLSLVSLRVISHGQKNGHLELLMRFILEPHIFLGHRGRSPNISRAFSGTGTNKAGAK